MNQIKIGRFIAERRKELNITQRELADRLSITDRAVSKWENGRAMPDSSLMLSLCEILGITVNDLLKGELVGEENYTEELEKSLIDMVKEKEEGDRRLLTIECVVGGLSIIVLLLPIIIASYVQMEDWLRYVIILSGVVPAFVGFHFALKIEQVAGYYECKRCAHRYVPSFKSVIFSMHMGRTRYMRCPRCNKKSWQKKVVSKNENEN